MKSPSSYVAPPNEAEQPLPAFLDFNAIIDSGGVVEEYRPGPFLPTFFPAIHPGRPIQEFFPPEWSEKFLQTLRAVQQSGRTHTFDSQLVYSDHAVWVDVRVVPISNSQFLFVTRDITTFKETELRMQQQLRKMAALRSVDLAIASGLDLNLLLAMLLDHVIELMKIDAVSILLQNPKSNLLEFTAGKGFRSTSLQYTHLRLGEGGAGYVAVNRQMLAIPDLRENQMEFGRSPLFHLENFIAYYGVPLIAKGQVLGVIEIFHRTPLNPDSEWLNFLNMIAGQAAIAIDNAVMFRELQKTNVELNLAYDATIEGLARALDLRDKETEEHTRRVSDLTVQLAARLGIGNTELAQLRRGAILHDVGKMAIPDRILFKPGPLTDEEWTIMRRHPDIAVDLLSSVSYLIPALDIPHWHHEKWDGSGYPDKLRGEEIPLSARLFALVDVYDALTSNRPYRSAWSKHEVLEYINGQSGRHFDPSLVPGFVQFMGGQSL